MTAYSEVPVSKFSALEYKRALGELFSLPLPPSPAFVSSLRFIFSLQLSLCFHTVLYLHTS